MIVNTEQIGWIAFLRVWMIVVHLHKDSQIIILVVDRRVSQLLIVIPANDESAIIRLIVVTRAIDSNLLGYKPESIIFIDLLDYPISNAHFSLQQVRCIFFQIRINIQRQALISDFRKIVVGDHDIRQISAQHCCGVFLRRQIDELYFHADLVFKILPHSQLVFSIDTFFGAVLGITYRQDRAFLLR